MTLAERIVTSCSGRSLLSVSTLPIRSTVAIPLHTRPKIVCFPSRCGVGANVTKNCEPAGNITRSDGWGAGMDVNATEKTPRKLMICAQHSAHITRAGIAGGELHDIPMGPTLKDRCSPLVLGPEFAMERMPAPVCLSSGCISSANLPLRWHAGRRVFHIKIGTALHQPRYSSGR